MRITLDIADDVLAAAEERARREHTSIGQVVSELVREALTTPRDGASAQPSRARGVHGLQPFASRGVVVTNELIDVLRQDVAT
jgi:hypothetical protein